MVGESAGLFTSTTIDWQIKRSPVSLISPSSNYRTPNPSSSY
ncbi:MAG: hypothetical protein V7K26_03535 [Nostoc sp.]